MAKIYSPNKQYTGISAGVAFAQGVGEATDEYLIDWFKNHGYEVEAEAVEEDLKFPDPDDSDPGPIDPGDINPDDSDPDGEINLDTFTVEELIEFAEVNEIDIGKATSKEGILKKISEAAEVKE